MSRIIDEVYGKKLDYDPDFKGPRRYRSCTDLSCLFLFVAFLASWGFIGFYAFRNGDITAVMFPTDSQGRVCGRDPEVAHLKYLFFFDLTVCGQPDAFFSCKKTPQVCVESCPKFNWAADTIFKSPPSSWELVQKQLICKSRDIAKGVNSMNQFRKVIEENQCASYYIKSHAIVKRCIPTPFDVESARQFLDNHNVNVTNGSKALQYYEQFKITLVTVIVDTNLSKLFIFYGIIAAFVVCIVYIILLRWLSGIMIWLSLISFIVLLTGCLAFSYNKYITLKSNPGTNTYQLAPSVLHRSFDDYMTAFNTNPDVWFWMIIIVGVMLLLSVMLIICLRKRIRIAIALIKEGSKAIGSILSSLTFPVIPWLLDLLFITWAVFVFLNLHSLGGTLMKVENLSIDKDCICSNSYKDGDECNLTEWNASCHKKTSLEPCIEAKCASISRETDNVIDYLHLYNFFGLLWGMAFVSGFSQMVLASVFAKWYWTFQKRDVPFFVVFSAISKTVTYHLGTIAFGSLLIAVCGFIRVMIEYVQKTAKKYQDNAVAKAVLWCFRLCFTFLEAVLRFISRNAYIMCAIHGTNFIVSAKDAFGLLSRNAIRLVVLDQVTSLLFFIGKLLVTGFMACLAYYFLIVQKNELKDQLYYPGVPIAIIGIFSFLIASTFFKVYTMAIETLFLCFCEDSERNDGSASRPYYMSKSLMKILHRKNT